MIKSYINIALRSLYQSRKGKSPLYLWISILGLMVGLTAFLSIGQYVSYQYSFDTGFPNHKNIYRTVVERQESGVVTMASAKTFAGMGHHLISEMPEVHEFNRILDEECMFKYKPENITFNRQRTFWADGNFHSFFGLEWVISGNPDLLNEPNHCIVSKSAAERFFGSDWSGDSNPIGKTVFLNEHIPFMIQGVFEDLPINAHMNVDFVVSYSTLMVLVGDHMDHVMPPGGNFVYNYISLKNGTEPKDLTSRLNDVVEKHTGNLEDGVNYAFSLQPLSSIHLNSHLSDELNPNGNALFVLALSIAAGLILIIAWINFINLTTARAMNRAKEVGIRKAIGAQKLQLARQFSIETLTNSIIAAVLGALLAISFSEKYIEWAGIPDSILSQDYLDLWTLYILVVVVGSVLASLYPAAVLSSFDPIKALKGKALQINDHAYFRKGLIVFQFASAIVLVVCTLTIYGQIQFMRDQDLGTELDQVLVLNSPRSMIGNTTRAEKFEHFRDVLMQTPGIEYVASGGCLPGKNFLYHRDNIQPEGMDLPVNWSFDLASVDEYYLPSLEMEIIAGRNFLKRPDETNKVILNEKGANALGYLDPLEAIGRTIRYDNQSKQIVGVVKDAHYKDLQKEIQPLLLTYGHDYEFGFFPIKMNSSNLRELIPTIENEWSKSYPKDPIDYFFLDEFFDSQYNEDQAFGRMFGAFSILSILIVVTGLIGLVSFSTYQRTKEIGIRKVLGANVLSIVKLINFDFFVLLMVASFIAIPGAIWIITLWLDTFAHKIGITWWIVLSPVLIILLICTIAVSGHTLKAALSNPVDSLQEE